MFKDLIAVCGIFPDQLTAEDAVETLKLAGARNAEISVLFPDMASSRLFGAASLAPGAVMGGALGALPGIDALAIPGVGQFIAAGPLMGMLGGIGAAAAPGGIHGALAGLGLAGSDAVRCESRLHHGAILLSVRCEDPDVARRYKEILYQTGAEDVSSTQKQEVNG